MDSYIWGIMDSEANKQAHYSVDVTRAAIEEAVDKMDEISSCAQRLGISWKHWLRAVWEWIKINITK